MKYDRLIIFLAVFCASLDNMIIMPIVSPLIRELGLTEVQGGLMISLGSVAMMATGAMWGARSDHVGRKPILLIGFAGLFCSYCTYTFIVHLGLTGALAGANLLASLFCGRAFVGAFLPTVPSAAQAYMADVTKDQDRASGMALISAASGLGMVFGPAIGGAVVMAGLIWPLVLATVLPGLAFLLVLAVLPRTRPTERPYTRRLNPFTAELAPWLLAGLMTMLSIITLQVSAGFYFQDRLGLNGVETARMLAISLTLVGVLLIFTQAVQIKVLKWRPRTLVIVGAPIFAAGLVVMLTVISPFAFYLAYAVFGVGAGLIIPGYMSGASLAVAEDRQGAAAGLLAMVQGLGAIVSPLGSTLLYQVSPSAPFALCAGLMGVALSAALAARSPGKGLTPRSGGGGSPVATG